MTRMTQTHETTPNDRATSFEPVQGNAGEQYSGTALLVTAYAVLWVLLFAWIALVWRKQSGIAARLGELERAIDKAAGAGAGKPKA
jgi:hypothetical protein